MLELFSESVAAVLVLAITLFLVGAWQHTRCLGFVLLAASFVLERLFAWGFRGLWAVGGDPEAWMFLFWVLPLLTLALAAAGGLSIYRHFRPAPPAAT